ncbi:hypothetical protein NLJ89_g6777 [Agrocybe chaxingu]|uniref:Uncharacterized protein n=1 Tax=Agrocybe chaxingu TaxID=84603 RepID=A0A9W8K4W6_9AGAR|nr:hypothetical protein NLJ89_g6777 [Agrocybe chaxingu]
MHSVAVPQHLHYRDICSRLNNPGLWTRLARLDDLRAPHIRSLTILPDVEFVYAMHEHIYDLRERLPSEFSQLEWQPLSSRTPEACRDCEIRLVSALKRMSCLQRFRWYRVPRPALEGPNDVWSTLARLGTVKELDILDEPVREFEVPAVALSATFPLTSGFTTLKLRTSVCNLTFDPKIPQLERMLLDNCPNLEVLELVLDFVEEFNNTANVDHLLRNALWPNLRVFRLRGTNCREPELKRFLIAHPSLEELALSRMMPGHAWTRLELPEDALPNLRHLECSSAQAAALLQYSSRWPLETLIGIEVHDTVVDSKYFSWDEEWEEDVTSSFRRSVGKDRRRAASSEIQNVRSMGKPL